MLHDQHKATKSLAYGPTKPTSHSQAGTLRVKKADVDAAGSGGSCSPWHDESGSQPVQLPGKQTKSY